VECTVLSGATLTDRLRVLGFLVARAGWALRVALASPFRAARFWRVATPERLLIAPQDVRTGDPTIAAEIGAGYFAFGGKIVSAGAGSPFAIEAGSDSWARQLNGFGWLRHLRAADDPSLKARARVLVDAFLATSARPAPGPAWETKVTARRMLAWLSQSPIILEGGDRVFYGRFMEALGVTRLHLERRIAEGLSGDARLLAAIALAEFGLCAPEASGFQRQGTDLLASEIGAQVLADGGHIGRNPQLLIDFLLDLLPLRQAYAARGIAAPTPVLNAIDRMIPMLRLFRHGDGTLALFNGMSTTAPELVATILAYDDARAQPLANAPYSGYQRMEAGTSVVIADAGAPPPPTFSTQAHAGCLSFEFSRGAQRIVVNCGAPEISRPAAREAARATAAHSTLTIDDTSSCRFAVHSGLQKWLADQILGGPEAVTQERLHADGFTTLKLSHDGYAQRFGFIHHRELALSADGARLEGRDALEPSGGKSSGGKSSAGESSAGESSAGKSSAGKSSSAKGPEPVPYVLRFHLHPAIEARMIGDNIAVLLDLPNEDCWLFQADAPIALEGSMMFAASGGPRATTQIRVSATTADRSAIHWGFTRRPGRGAGKA
jgi:uncharacterized heparinase superfamily protein